MNRKYFIVKVVFLIVICFFTLNGIYSQENIVQHSETRNGLSGFQKVDLGALDIFILSDGFLRLTEIESFSSRAKEKKVKQVLTDNFRPTNYIDMALNIPLIKTKERLVLIDAGMGIFADENCGVLLQSLHKVGFKPEQITDIFISHAHIDHIGGLIDKNNTMVFPNATYHIAQKEFEFWINATIEDFRNSDLYHIPEKAQFDIDAAKRILTIIQPKVTYFDYEKPLYGHFTFELVPGHTPGMTFITISSDSKELIYIADQAHSDVLLFPYPEWGYFADVDLNVAIASRKRMNKQLSDTKATALGYHLPYPGLGHVQKNRAKYQWKPVLIFTPGVIKL